MRSIRHSTSRRQTSSPPSSPRPECSSRHMRSRSRVSLRAEVLRTAREMHRLGLVVGTAGNVSARENELMYITPKALPYDEMTEGDVVKLSLDGESVGGGRE